MLNQSWLRIVLAVFLTTLIVSCTQSTPDAVPTVTEAPEPTATPKPPDPTATPADVVEKQDDDKDAAPVVLEKVTETYLGLAGMPYDDGVTQAQYPGPAGTRWFPALGPEDAEVTVLEFSEILCGHCQNFNQNSLHGILEDYVATGKVRYVGHFLAFNRPESQEYLAAAMCAAEQGRYFAYEHTVYASIAQQEFDLDVAAKQVEGLDYEQFAACKEEGRYKNTVIDASMAASEKGLRATPTFLVNGQKLEGNDPGTLRRMIEEALSGGTTVETTQPGEIPMPKNPMD